MPVHGRSKIIRQAESQIHTRVAPLWSPARNSGPRRSAPRNPASAMAGAASSASDRTRLRRRRRDHQGAASIPIPTAAASHEPRDPVATTTTPVTSAAPHQSRRNRVCRVISAIPTASGSARSSTNPRLFGDPYGPRRRGSSPTVITRSNNGSKSAINATASPPSASEPSNSRPWRRSRYVVSRTKSSSGSTTPVRRPRSANLVYGANPAATVAASRNARPRYRNRDRCSSTRRR